MADTKLPALASAVVALGDLVYVVDISDTTDDATGSSRKTTLQSAFDALGVPYSKGGASITENNDGSVTVVSSLLHLSGASTELRLGGSAINQNLTESFYDNDATLKGRLIYAGGNVGGSRHFGVINDAGDFLAFFTINNTPIQFWPNGALAWQITAAGNLTSAGVGFDLDLASAGWVRNHPGCKRLVADVTNATTTLSNLTDLSVTLAAGRKYTGVMAVRCSDSVAADGVKFDFNGGTATMTSFNAGATGNVQGATAGTTVSAALATALNFTAMNGTGDHWLTFAVSLVVNAGGSFIPRLAQNSHSTGTATAALGSYLALDDSPN